MSNDSDSESDLTPCNSEDESSDEETPAQPMPPPPSHAVAQPTQPTPVPPPVAPEPKQEPTPSKTKKTGTAKRVFKAKKTEEPKEINIDPYINQGAQELTMCIKFVYDWLENATIDLDPDYQRDVVWSDHKQISLIDSLYHQFFVPPILIVTRSTNDGTMRTCIDGKQRLSSIRRFIEGEIPWKDSRSGSKFWFTNPESKPGRKLLSNNMKTRFQDTEIKVAQYKGISLEQEREIFQRVQNGISLTPAERLHAINGHRANLVRRVTSLVLSPEGFETHIPWESGRGKGFQSVGMILFLLYEEWKTSASYSVVKKDSGEGRSTRSGASASTSTTKEKTRKPKTKQKQIKMKPPPEPTIPKLEEFLHDPDQERNCVPLEVEFALWTAVRVLCFIARDEGLREVAFVTRSSSSSSSSVAGKTKRGRGRPRKMTGSGTATASATGKGGAGASLHQMDFVMAAYFVHRLVRAIEIPPELVSSAMKSKPKPFPLDPGREEGEEGKNKMIAPGWSMNQLAQGIGMLRRVVRSSSPSSSTAKAKSKKKSTDEEEGEEDADEEEETEVTGRGTGTRGPRVNSRLFKLSVEWVLKLDEARVEVVILDMGGASSSLGMSTDMLSFFRLGNGVVGKDTDVQGKVQPALRTLWDWEKVINALKGKLKERMKQMEKLKPKVKALSSSPDEEGESESGSEGDDEGDDAEDGSESDNDNDDEEEQERPLTIALKLGLDTGKKKRKRCTDIPVAWFCWLEQFALLHEEEVKEGHEEKEGKEKERKVVPQPEIRRPTTTAVNNKATTASNVNMKRKSGTSATPTPTPLVATATTAAAASTSTSATATTASSSSGDPSLGKRKRSDRESTTEHSSSVGGQQENAKARRPGPGEEKEKNKSKLSALGKIPKIGSSSNVNPSSSSVNVGKEKTQVEKTKDPRKRAVSGPGSASTSTGTSAQARARSITAPIPTPPLPGRTGTGTNTRGAVSSSTSKPGGVTAKKPVSSSKGTKRPRAGDDSGDEEDDAPSQCAKRSKPLPSRSQVQRSTSEQVTAAVGASTDTGEDVELQYPDETILPVSLSRNSRAVTAPPTRDLSTSTETPAAYAQSTGVVRTETAGTGQRGAQTQAPYQDPAGVSSGNCVQGQGRAPEGMYQHSQSGPSSHPQASSSYPTPTHTHAAPPPQSSQYSASPQQGRQDAAHTQTGAYFTTANGQVAYLTYSFPPPQSQAPPLPPGHHQFAYAPQPNQPQTQAPGLVRQTSGSGRLDKLHEAQSFRLDLESRQQKVMASEVQTNAWMQTIPTPCPMPQPPTTTQQQTSEVPRIYTGHPQYYMQQQMQTNMIHLMNPSVPGVQSPAMGNLQSAVHSLPTPTSPSPGEPSSSNLDMPTRFLSQGSGPDPTAQIQPGGERHYVPLAPTSTGTPSSGSR
ncbi:hypothetical protein VKT23_015574 [Stygiomarasmius scandens]|uniref:GmrSD restriction endonucleases N-terminal domain-containing protein n=1 Tax=Marasmiellus scandens TaxID=2682957 RepID=A0ABR1IXM5_9AGAR